MYASIWAWALSQCVKGITRIPIPKPLRPFVLRRFATLFGIKLHEVEKPLSAYPSLNAFFIRFLKPDCRPIKRTPTSIVSPVDGAIVGAGKILEHELFLVKNQRYTLSELVGPQAPLFVNGHFATLYLSPKDCHHIFAPCDGDIVSTVYFPGGLFPVREPYISKIPNLYAKNERILITLDTPFGHVGVLLVAAINVGCMTLPFDPDITTNHCIKEPPSQKNYPPIPVKKGQPIGTFHLGSTVVLLFEKEKMKWNQGFLHNHPIQYGESIGSFLSSV